jgi:hypothetical protein
MVKPVVYLVLILLLAGLASGKTEMVPAAGPVATGYESVDGGWQSGQALPLSCGCEGLTPGYWKNHLEDWPPTGYAPGDTVGSVFSAVSSHFPGLADDTLLEALSYPGGPGAEGGARILLRAAVAALLNAAHPGLNFPDAPESVIINTNNAIASENRQTMLSLAAYWDFENNLGGSLD